MCRPSRDQQQLICEKPEPVVCCAVEVNDYFQHTHHFSKDVGNCTYSCKVN